MTPAGEVVRQAVPPASGPRTLNGRDLGLSVLVGLAIVYGHRDALAGMVALWNGSPMYSYGFTVPIISAYLVWVRRAEFSRLSPSPSLFSGTLVAIVAVGMAVAARAGGIQLLDQLAFLVSLTAAALLLFGAPYLKLAWPALAYLLLMIPVWDGFTESLHEPFQLRSATIGVWILQALGIPAHRQGTVIDLSEVTIQVARACSGVNYLVAVIALGLPLAYLFLTGVWRRLLLIVTAIVVAALSNGLRVALIGILVHLHIGSPLHGPFHVLHGLFVAGMGYIVLFAGLWLLSPRHARKDALSSDRALDARTSPEPPRTSRVSAGAAFVLTALFLVVGSNALSMTSHAVALSGELQGFPAQLGDWVWDRDLPGGLSGTAGWPGSDSELRRRYRRADGARAELYVGYYASQQQRKKLVNSAATVLHHRASRRRVADLGTTFDVNHVDAKVDGIERLFWYQLDGRAVTSAYVVKLRTLWDAVTQGRSNGAVIVLSAGAGNLAAGQPLADLAPLVERALAEQLAGAGTDGNRRSK